MLGASWGTLGHGIPAWTLLGEPLPSGRGWVQEENPDLPVMLAQNLVSATQSQDWAREMLLSSRSRSQCRGDRDWGSLHTAL